MEISEGPGWRLMIDPRRAPFSGLIGGDHWAGEVTAAELAVLRDAVGRLTAQHRALAESLMAEEELEIDLELPIAAPTGGHDGSLWLGLSGDRRHWSLRFVLTAGPGGGRSLEGGWSATASAAFAAALEQLRPMDGDPGHQHC